MIQSMAICSVVRVELLSVDASDACLLNEREFWEDLALVSATIGRNCP